MNRRRGSQFVEAGLALLPLCGLLFLAVDTAWALWVKATLQHAVREGVRYAVTGQTSPGLGHIASIKSVVQQHAMGLLNASRAGALHVRFFDSSTLAETASNAGGNVVEVSVETYSLVPLAPLFRSRDPFSITVRAADLIEPPPGGVMPTP